MLIHCWFHLLLLLCASSVHSVPPPSPIECDIFNNANCRLYNSYGVWNDRIDCPLSDIRYPKTEEEIRQIVAEANQNNLRVRVVSKFSHTIPKLSCPSSTSSTAILISTSNYDTSIEVDVDNLSVTADSGVGLRDLINKVEAAGLSLVAAPYWEGVSIGGLISTGAHGSSWWDKGGSVHDHVIGISIVVPTDRENEKFAKIIRLRHDDDDPQLFNAAKLSLGLLGVISKVTLSVEQGFKRSITYHFKENDEGLEDEFMNHALSYEFGDITWYPSQYTCVYRYDNRVPLTTPGDGEFDFLGFRSNDIDSSAMTRTAEEIAEESKNVSKKCEMAVEFMSNKKWLENGLKKDETSSIDYPVIGTQGKMQTSGSCLYSWDTKFNEMCRWDRRSKGLFFYESTAIFPATRFGDFILDVKALRDLAPENFCGVDIYNGFLIRFIKTSHAHLGQSEDSVVVDFNYYRDGYSWMPRLNQDVLEEVEQMAFFKHGAKPHWAKNRNLAFLNVKGKYPRFHMFWAAKGELDPKGMFSNVFTDEIFSGDVAEKGDGCALEGQCVCSDDRHCSPSNGYLCKRGLIYTEARVCRYNDEFL